jgi:hypothetical protein
MDSLETIAKDIAVKFNRIEESTSNFFKRHPVLKGVAIFKLVQYALTSTIGVAAYSIWPEETSRFVNHCYESGKHCLDVSSPLIASHIKELVHVASNPNAALRTLPYV